MPPTSVLPGWLADGTPVDLSYIWFITLRDGRVTHFRDYMNPLQVSTR